MLSTIKALLRPRALSFKNRILLSGKARVAVFGAIGLVLWAGVFAGSFRVLAYFKSIEDLGDILAGKLLSMLFVVMLSLLVFSSIITTLSKLYLSRDLDLVHSLPVAARHLFFARWIESTADSSWMVVVFVLPVFLAYGLVYGAGLLFYASVALFLVLLCAAASAASAIGIALVVNLISASRLKTIFVFLGLLLFVLLYLAFRMMRPERLVDPELFATTLVYLKSLNAPASPWLPSTWAYDGVRAAMNRDISGLMFNLLLCGSCAGGLLVFMLITADAVYFSGFSRSSTGWADPVRPEESPRRRFVRDRSWLAFLPAHVRAFLVKEVRTFVRDQSQWSQLFLIAALVVIYLYNFRVLPLDKSPMPTVWVQNIFAFLNMGLAAFVLTAVTARFAFPAVSMEKSAFWIVQCAPVSMRTFLRIKFLVYVVPLFVLTMILIVTTNLFLQVSDVMMVLSVATVSLMVPAIVAMGVGIGAVYPDFSSENAAQAVSSFGGFVFMATSAVYVIVVIALEAGPARRLFFAGLRGIPLRPEAWFWIAVSFGIVVAISVFATVFSLRLGERRLQGR
ncbi:MAG: putative ABC transporter permease subunit [Thermodesulfobacteriota bacterium]